MMILLTLILFCVSVLINFSDGFTTYYKVHTQLNAKAVNSLSQRNHLSYQPGRLVVASRQKPLRDLLGLGAPEIGIALVVALVLFGPETLKSLSKDLGKAAAELKEIPKTFKEGMDEGADSVQVSKMKAIAAEKRKLRDEKIAAKSKEDDVDDYDDDLPAEK